MAEGEIYDIEYDPKSAQPDVPDRNVGDKERRMTEERMIETIPRRLANLLRANGMAQAELAAEIGATPVTVSRYLTGQRSPRAPYIIRMARSLATTPDYILTGVLRASDGTMLYECDPEKNPECRKTGCACGAARGKCYMTAKESARAE